MRAVANWPEVRSASSASSPSSVISEPDSTSMRTSSPLMRSSTMRYSPDFELVTRLMRPCTHSTLESVLTEMALISPLMTENSASSPIWDEVMDVLRPFTVTEAPSAKRNSRTRPSSPRSWT